MSNGILLFVVVRGHPCKSWFPPAMQGGVVWCGVVQDDCSICCRVPPHSLSYMICIQPWRSS